MKSAPSVLCSVILLILTCAAAGCFTGHTPEKPSVKLTIKVPTLAMTCTTNPNVREAYTILTEAAADFSTQYKDADVKIDIVKFDLAQEDNYIPKCFDTNLAANILYEDFFNMNTYIHTGRVVPLDDIIDEQWRRDVPTLYWRLSQIQGKTYMLPYLARQNVVGYNKSLFRTAGLDKYVYDGPEIQSWTLAEWEEILAALEANLPDNTYAMAMYAKNEQSDTHTMTWIRSHGSSMFDTNNRFHLNTPEGIAGLQWLKDNYDKNYYPPKSENLVIRDCGKLFQNNQLAIKMVNGPSAEASGENTGLVNFPSVDGKGIATTFITGFEVFDNGDPLRLKVAKDFLKFFFHTEKYLDYSAGNMPVSMKVTEKYKDKIYRLEAFQKNADRIVDFTAGNPNWRGVRRVFYPHIQDLLRGTRTPAEVAADIDQACNAEIEIGYQQSKLHP